MKKIKVMTVFGTRPEAIKMAPLHLKLKSFNEIDAVCCVTAQHREMLDSVLNIFNITPEYDLDVMQKTQSLTSITTRVLERLNLVIEQSKPDLVLVHGDTSTAFVAALSSFYNKTKIGHVEAGLRSFDKYSPYPEEMNRKLIGSLADLHFAPTAQNKQNLINEGITNGIFVTGNTAIDTVKLLANEKYSFKSSVLKNIDFSQKKYILVTAHRRENYGEGMENIMQALKHIAESFSDVHIIYPVHPAPYVKETAQKYLGNMSNVQLIDPIDVDDNLNLISRCYMVMSDSGGIQEEAPALGKPVLVLRRETERPEAVLAGTVKIAGVEKTNIISLASLLLTDENEYNKMARAVNPYGDGAASSRIADAILYSFGLSKSLPNEFSV